MRSEAIVLDTGAPGYEFLIQRWLYEFHQYSAPNEVRFEAISAAIFGSKQRRYGPMPSAEVQVSVREIIRQSMDKDGVDHITFFLPWGSRKQEDGGKLDILEFMALKQLACLQKDLAKYGVTSEFHIRIEDLTDYWLFVGVEGNKQQVDLYATQLAELGRRIMAPHTFFPVKESELVTWKAFYAEAMHNQGLFKLYLEGNSDAGKVLANDGWEGGIPEVQREYYYKQYKLFYPDVDPAHKLAEYLGAVKARHNLTATGLPTQPHIFLTFGHPIPGNPNAPNRLFYRTIPERFTNNHRSPWLARGYLQIDEENNLCPKSLGFGDNTPLYQTQVDVQGIPIQTPYLLV